MIYGCYQPPNRTLTPRQVEVLALVAEGLTYREIGIELQVEKTTINTHVSDIIDILGARNATHAVVLGIQRGLLAFKEDGYVI